MATNEKVWFITGASRGFGRIWTEAALERGDLVAASARDLHSLDDLVATHGDALLPLRSRCGRTRGTRR
jgi:NAD(P)-dependent dehydrogenase (short-subunit alcohol dehydrogenase family)